MPLKQSELVSTIFTIAAQALKRSDYTPDGARLLTSVSYLLQAVNYVKYFANFSDKSTVCFGTSETLAPSGVFAEILEK